MNLYRANLFLEAEYHRLPIWYLTSFLMGVLCCLGLNDIPPKLIIILCSMVALFGIAKYLQLRMLQTFLLILVIAFSLGYLRAYIRQSQLPTFFLEEPMKITLRGHVHSIKYSEKGAWIYLENLIYGELEENLPKKVRIKIQDHDARRVRVGDYIESYSHLMPLSTSILPDTYNFGMDAYYRNIGAYGYSIGGIDIIERAKQNIFTSSINYIRKALYYNFLNNMGAQKGNFAAALFLGEQRGIKKDTLQNMRLSGISHILCVSGMHLSLVAGIFFFFFRFCLNLSNYLAFNIDIRKLSAIISIFASFVYLLISSTGIASIRAFIMTFLVMLSMVMGRRILSLRSVAIAAFLIIMVNPEYILYPSFQLSFMAASALIAGYELYIEHKRYLCINSNHILFRILNGILLNIYSSIVATIGTGILVIYHFYIISNYVILGNLFALPIVAFAIMPLGIISIILIPFGLEGATLNLMGICIKMVTYIAEQVTNLKHSVYYFGHIDSAYLLLSLFGLFWIIIWQSRVRILGIFPILFSLILMINSSKPDLLINLDIGFIGYRNEKGEFEIMGKKLSKFHLDFVSNYYGKKSSIYHNIDIASRNHKIRTIRGKQVLLYFVDPMPDSISSDMILDLRNDKKSKLVIYCNKEQCSNG